MPEATKHVCDPPAVSASPIPWASGDSWRCDECGQEWVATDVGDGGVVIAWERMCEPYGHQWAPGTVLRLLPADPDPDARIVQLLKADASTPAYEVRTACRVCRAIWITQTNRDGNVLGEGVITKPEPGRTPGRMEYPDTGYQRPQAGSGGPNTGTPDQ